jgi:hypothetical protein
LEITDIYECLLSSLAKDIAGQKIFIAKISESVKAVVLCNIFAEKI